MKRALVEVFIPTDCVLDWNIVFIILEMADLVQLTRRSAYFYLYTFCPICDILQLEEKTSDE